MESEKNFGKQEERKEYEVKETKVLLYFIRHGKKEKNKDKKEENLRLTPEGRQQADVKGKELNPQAEVALGWGSSNERAQETAYRTMLANEDINPDDSLEEIEAKIAKEMKVGKKLIIDNRLNFVETGPTGKEFDEAYNEGRYLPYVINESDRRAMETGDQESTCYIRKAGNVAEIVKRYVSAGNVFNRIASKKDDYEKYGNQLERYLGTHMGTSESFVAKVLENTSGLEKRKEFTDSVGGGFGETEGIKIKIINNKDGQKIILYYAINGKEEKVEFNAELLDDIIKEKNEFNVEVKMKDSEGHMYGDGEVKED